MRPFRRDGNGAMDGPYGQVEDTQVARLAAADQGDRDEKRPGNTLVRAIANNEFARQRLNSRWWAELRHMLGPGDGTTQSITLPDLRILANLRKIGGFCGFAEKSPHCRGASSRKDTVS